MADCFIYGQGGSGKQLGIYPVGEDSRPVGDVTVPDGVISLYRYVFENDTVVTSVKLPETLKSILAYSFSGCDNLVSINLPLSLNTIESYSFYQCKSLVDIRIPENIVTFGDCVFRNSGLQSITFDAIETITIPKYTFDGCSNLNTINIQDTVTSVTVSQYAFQDCIGLTDDVVNPIISKLTSLGTYAFAGCTGLKNVTPKYCNDYMFSGCTEIISAVINRTLSDGTSGEYVFQNCKKLTDITFSDTAISKLKTIQQYYLKGCTSLTSFIVPANVTTINKYAFSGCTGLRYLYLPATITSLTSSAISSCTALENIELGQDWNLSFDFSFATNLTVDSIVAMFNSLKDLTGETAKTLTLGSTLLLKTTEEQRAIATNKNWTLA